MVGNEVTSPRAGDGAAMADGRSPLTPLAMLSDELLVPGTRAELVTLLRARLVPLLGDARLEVGLPAEDDAHLEVHVLRGLLPGEPEVCVHPTLGCLERVREQGRHLITDLPSTGTPRLRPLADAGYRQQLLVPVTSGPATVGLLLVTTRGGIPDRLTHLSVVAAAVLSSRADRFSAPRHPDDRQLLRDQVTALRSRARVLERTDPLTRLPNRAAAFQAIGEARDAEQGERSFALIDLDHLKMTNDRLGHGLGDGVLRGVADRLRAMGEDHPITVYRFGGDEFAALNEGPADELRDVLETVSADLASHPLQVGGRDVATGFSAGVYAITGHGHGIEEIVSRAESAAQQAKRSGRGRVVLHEPGTSDPGDNRSDLLRMDAVRAAVLTGRLSLVAQPVVGIADGASSPMDAEVLVRLTDEEGRLLLPDDFVALAEQYDVVSALDRAVLTRVVRTLSDGCLERRVSCNVSPHSMLDPVFVDWAHDLVAGSRQGPRLVLELTERLPIGSTQAVRAGMEHLAGAGVEFALDDFGAGTTSYGNLRELPLQVLKVDGVLVRGCLTSEVDLAMLRSSLDVARALGIRAVAEGIETRDQLAAVIDLGADAVQGYYLGQPRPWPGHTP